jgi:hypothetical protein
VHILCVCVCVHVNMCVCAHVYVGAEARSPCPEGGQVTNKAQKGQMKGEKREAGGVGSQ